MPITKQQFRRYRTDEEKAKDKGMTISVYFNEEETAQLLSDMRLLQQTKDSTALKQLWKIGRNLLNQSQTGEVLKVVMANFTRNKKTGTNPEIELNPQI